MLVQMAQILNIYLYAKHLPEINPERENRLDCNGCREWLATGIDSAQPRGTVTGAASPAPRDGKMGGVCVGDGNNTAFPNSSGQRSNTGFFELY